MPLMANIYGFHRQASLCLTVLVPQGHLAGLHGVVHGVHLLVLLQLPSHRRAQLRVKHSPTNCIGFQVFRLISPPKIVETLLLLEEKNANLQQKQSAHV